MDASRYLSIPGADNLGMSLVVQAINDVNFRLPFVKVFYAPGVGGATVASYEDRPLAESIPQHVIVSGGVKADWVEAPDLVLAVNSPADGRTREANQPDNVTQANPSVRNFAVRVRSAVEAGRRVAVGDVAFGNGADNSLLPLLKEQGLLDRLAAYSPATVIPSIRSVGALIARCRSRSLAGCIARNMSIRLPAMVCSATGPAISPCSIRKPEAPRL